ncbi:MAG: hypothetical protein KDA21_11935 [Phycisphaerales bacterium]|nr:hypothetical protein [Phycisphaerales bacterium]
MLVCAGGVYLLAACAFEKNYEFWSLFLDGIPNPALLPITSGSEDGPVNIRQSPTYSAHQPFLDDRCDACHRDRFASTAANLDSRVCLTCHAGVPDQYERMHGPVAVGACLWCHNAHESRYSWLLKAEPRAVCAQCHQSDNLSADRVPAHMDASRSCLECHSGHGGAHALFLRDEPADVTVGSEWR